MADTNIITNEAELGTVDLSVLVTGFNGKLTPEEKAAWGNKQLAQDARRELAISYYKKYVIVASAEAEAAAKAAAEKKARLEAAANNPGQLQAPETAVTEAAKAAGLLITENVAVTIRNVTDYNGQYTISVEKLINILFKNPSATVVFKNEIRAKSVILLIENLTSLKGVPGVTAERKTKVIERIKATNGIK